MHRDTVNKVYTSVLAMCRNGSCSLNQIAGSTGLHFEKVKKCVDSFVDIGLLYKIPINENEGVISFRPIIKYRMSDQIKDITLSANAGSFRSEMINYVLEANKN